MLMPLGYAFGNSPDPDWFAAELVFRM
jgi:hypothetical protein